MDATGAGADPGERLTEAEWRERRRQRWMEHRRRRFPMFALLALVVGFGWLGNTLGWWHLQEGLFLPLALIVWGALALARWSSRGMGGTGR